MWLLVPRPPCGPGLGGHAPKGNITELQPLPLPSRYANHFRLPGRAASTEAFLITITLMALKAHMSNYVCSVRLKERELKLHGFSQQMLLDQMARNYYLDHWREVSGKITIWLSQNGPTPQLLIKGRSISKWDEGRTQKAFRALGCLNSSKMSQRRRCSLPSWVDAQTSVNMKGKQRPIYVPSICARTTVM